MIFSETRQEISKALVSAWGTIEAPKHNAKVKVQTKNGGTYEFAYTDLEGIFKAIKQVYKENKISVIQNAYTTKEDGMTMVSVETMLLHESGEWVKSAPLKVHASQNMQEMGGQITYMKRYSLAAMLGIAAEEDDDGNAAVGNQAIFKLTDAQVNRAFAIANASGFKPDQVKQVIMKDYQKTDVADLTKQQYDELCKRLEKAGKEQKHA